MAAEKATGLVVRVMDWSESSRIATIWTREFGKVRVLAKGGRRLKSNFEVALDLLSVCSIVLLRKSSGLDLLTEARVEERFPGLRRDLQALNAGYYVAELLGEGTQDYDPHPALFDRSIDALRKLSAGGDALGLASAYELAWLGELGLRPVFDRCVGCLTGDVSAGRVAFSAAAGGVLCSACSATQRDRRFVSRNALTVLNELVAGELPAVSGEVRQLLGHYVASVLGRRPRLASYLGS